MTQYNKNNLICPDCGVTHIRFMSDEEVSNPGDKAKCKSCAPKVSIEEIPTFITDMSMKTFSQWTGRAKVEALGKYHGVDPKTGKWNK